MKVWKMSHRVSDPSNPQQVVYSIGRSLTGEFLTFFCYIFTIVGVVTFTICFSLQEKYKEEVAKQYSEGFNYMEESIDGWAIYASRGGRAHGQ
jgi:hypothetical protein